MHYLIRAASLSGFEELVRSFNVNPITILDDVGLLPCQIRNPDEFISYKSCSDALELAAARCNCSNFGLRLSLNQGLSTLGVVGAYMSRQDTVLKALEIAQKYAYMHSEGIIINISIISEEQCELRYDILHGSNSIHEQKAQLSLGVIFRLMKEMIGSSWSIQKLCLKQPCVDDNEYHLKQAFDCEIEFDAGFDAFYFHPSFLKTKPAVPRILIDQLISQQFETQKLQKQPDLIALVEHTILILLVTGQCNKENIALCIEIHPRKLQRLLKAENTSYQEILDAVRKKEALRLLEKEAMSLTEIALNLGFSEFSVFSRKFKIWFDSTPSQWRKTLEDNGFDQTEMPAEFENIKTA